MGQVKILKSDELLVAAANKTDRRCSDGSKGGYEVDLSLGSINQLGPDLETMLAHNDQEVSLVRKDSPKSFDGT
ncbi:hypothetical protein PVK06_020172 [Gossypium arboreum]|uniref:Uncharacterized protein n=1 Tax=Gossypium arboreum TaxID=29729 RepID=A0ABR0PLV2_GOSAR|nr:hypothetical protein PVK06_020172 [Gossypium arboreum]